MREILFRAKRVDNGEWVEGSLIQCGITDKKFIFNKNDDANEVILETVCQYTGLTDKNSKKIFEGDIICSKYANAKYSEFIETVVFHRGKFCVEYKISEHGRSYAPLADGIQRIITDKSVYMESCEVIGNIHDNPELLEVK